MLIYFCSAWLILPTNYCINFHSFCTIFRFRNPNNRHFFEFFITSIYCIHYIFSMPWCTYYFVNSDLKLDESKEKKYNDTPQQYWLFVDICSLEVVVVTWNACCIGEWVDEEWRKDSVRGEIGRLVVTVCPGTEVVHWCNIVACGVR